MDELENIGYPITSPDWPILREEQDKRNEVAKSSILSQMLVIEIINSISLTLVTTIGLVIGWSVLGEGRTEFRKKCPSNADEDSKQVPINLGILYGTLTLVIASIVSEWPPEGQRFPAPIEEFVFFGSVLLTAIIVGRVVNLIWVLESEIEF